MINLGTVRTIPVSLLGVLVCVVALSFAVASAPAQAGLGPALDHKHVDRGLLALQGPSRQRDDGGQVLLQAAIAAIAGLGLGWMIGLVLNRREGSKHRDSPFLDRPDGRHLYVEGVADREGIGHFAGLVSAVIDGSGEDTSSMLLVQDPMREEPVWVRRSEVFYLQDDRPEFATGPNRLW